MHFIYFYLAYLAKTQFIILVLNWNVCSIYPVNILISSFLALLFIIKIVWAFFPSEKELLLEFIISDSSSTCPRLSRWTHFIALSTFRIFWLPFWLYLFLFSTFNKSSVYHFSNQAARSIIDTHYCGDKDVKGEYHMQLKHNVSLLTSSHTFRNSIQKTI